MSPTAKKCNWCEERLYATLTDFCEYGWAAIKFGKSKAIIACPKHTDNLEEYTLKTLRK